MSDEPELSAAETDNGPRPAGNGAAGAYRVRLDQFEGPLDLLLHLIKKNEVDVRELPVAQITEQYLGYLDLMRDLSLDIAGEYLVMAATLTLIKSRLLLPSPEPEEGEEADPRADLVRQLLEYQRYREAAESLAERPLLRRDTFAREANAEGIAEDPDAVPRVKVTLWELVEAFAIVLKRAAPDPVHQVEGEAVSLPARIQGLLQTLAVARTVRFDTLFGEAPTRSYVIVTFLAVLELIKQHVVEAVQDEIMGPIDVALLVDDVAQVSIDLLDEYGGTPAPAPAGSPDE
ncbi:MAG: segregation/condensation protein A [Deltaproteobacteria bacterium]|nr:segregation/condensation protein A [Deltaproteobacteria bacterium]